MTTAQTAARVSATNPASPYLHAAFYRDYKAGTLCGSDRSDDRRTSSTSDVTCPACRQRIDGGPAADVVSVVKVADAHRLSIRKIGAAAWPWVTTCADCWPQQHAHIILGEGAVSVNTMIGNRTQRLATLAADAHLRWHRSIITNGSSVIKVSASSDHPVFADLAKVQRTSRGVRA